MTLPTLCCWRSGTVAHIVSACPWLGSVGIRTREAHPDLPISAWELGLLPPGTGVSTRVWREFQTFAIHALKQRDIDEARRKSLDHGDQADVQQQPEQIPLPHLRLRSKTKWAPGVRPVDAPGIPPPSVVPPRLGGAQSPARTALFHEPARSHSAPTRTTLVEKLMRDAPDHISWSPSRKRMTCGNCFQQRSSKFSAFLQQHAACVPGTSSRDVQWRFRKASLPQHLVYHDPCLAVVVVVFLFMMSRSLLLTMTSVLVPGLLVLLQPLSLVAPLSLLLSVWRALPHILKCLITTPCGVIYAPVSRASTQRGLYRITGSARGSQ